MDDNNKNNIKVADVEDLNPNTIFDNIINGTYPDYLLAMTFKRKFIFDEEFRNKYITKELIEQVDKMNIHDNKKIINMASLAWNKILDEMEDI